MHVGLSNKFSIQGSKRKIASLQFSDKTVEDYSKAMSVGNPSDLNTSPFPQLYSPAGKRQMFQRVDRFSVLQPIKKEEDKLTDKDIMRQLQESPEQKLEDQIPKQLVGSQSARSYFQHYKVLNKVKQQNDYHKINDSIQTQMLKQAESLDVLPCKLGLIKLNGNESQVSINNHHYGDKYISVLSEGLRQNQGIKEFLLSNNRIKQDGAVTILNQIGKQATVIDLSKNDIGQLGVDCLCQQLQMRENKMEVINIEDNKLGDKFVMKILKCLLNTQNKVKVLNISKNFLTNEICDLMKEIILQLDLLEELYIHWNQIKGSGGQKIFEALIENKNMVVFDGSWNGFGISEKSNCTQKVCDFLSQNKVMLHCDLSANQFTLQDCKLIANSLKPNRTMYGFHFAGNWGVVDPRGFLIIDDNAQQKVLGETLRIKGLEQVTTLRHEDVCWICEGWQEQVFDWIPDGECDPLFLHMNFEEYKQVYIPKRNDGTYKLPLMIPTGQTQFLFTVIDNQTTAVNYDNIKFGHVIKLKVNGINVSCQLDNINVVKKLKHFQLMDKKEMKALTSVLPRTPDPIYIPPKLKKQKRIWSFPISIWFKDFRFENEEFLRKCFEKDWSCSKISKVVKNPDEFNEVKNLLWKDYKMIKETYKWYSSYNPSGDVWSISSNVITDFSSTTELVDNKTFKLSDLDLKFIATCAASIEYKGNYRNPERALCRYQFMEFLVRVSDDKYLKQKQANNMVDSVQMILDQCRPIMQQYNAQKWRDERYFNEQCDDCLKYYKTLLNYVYNRYSIKKVKPGQKKFMCLDELHEICGQAGLFDEKFVDRDADLAFNLSMMLQIDELESDRIFQMTFVEFMEAIARIAEKVSLPAAPDMSWEQRQQQPLHIKLERLLILLAQTCASEEYKQQFGNPQKSIFDVQPEDD
ncbi:unnamed protein product [Paramecium pentaurelia]|uniref:Leucine Rich Repeat family protein n=1 Tax=Paramecium pentaurelia TaxID=43138 RepID=A0A8S1URL9_9CILI|nr:unnamed protein product [Paramecium pentaurelia]